MSWPEPTLAALAEPAQRLLSLCRARGVVLTTAESCTGGLIAAALTEIPGASCCLHCAFIVYSDEAKTRLIGVSPELAARHGAVSREVAIAMAEGALVRARAGLAIAATGIAGPGGATAGKPVGTVHIAVARTASSSISSTLHKAFAFTGTRSRIRLATVAAALQLAEDALRR